MQEQKLQAAIAAAVQIQAAIGSAIQEAGQIPSGHLYAMLMGRMDLPAYERMVDALVRAGLVRRKGHLLVWVGPAREVAS